MRLLLALLDFIFSAISWEKAQALGDFCGWAASCLARKRYRMSLSNIAAAFPEKSGDEHRAIAKQAWANAGRIATEVIKSRSLPRERLDEVVLFEDLELCESLRKEGRGFIVNIGHMVNWEVGGIGFTSRGWPLGVVARVMKNPAAEEWLRSTRGRFGEVVFSHRSPFFPSMKWLRKGNMVAVLIDHNLYEGGEFFPFFGRPAATSTLSALLAVKANCPIVSTKMRREGEKIIVGFEGPLRPDPDADPDKEVIRLTAEMVKVLERRVRSNPGQWLWGHNRWKRQPEPTTIDPVPPGT